MRASGKGRLGADPAAGEPAAHAARGSAPRGQVERLRRAFHYSLAGLRDAWREPACRLEIYAMALALPLALWLPLPAVDRLLLAGSVVAVFVVELLNTSVEAAVDRIGDEHHELSRMAKDLGSAAVLVAAIFAAAAWLVLAGPAVLALARA